MKIICVGRNYHDHIKELNNEIPENPVIFLKPDTAILQNDTFVLPEFSNNVHYEVEVLLKISKVGKYIQPQFAHKYYEQIGLGIDFTARDLQDDLKAKGLPWEIAKAFDGSAVIGQFFPKTAFADINQINFRLEKNNEVVQIGNTANMKRNFDVLISYISQFFTLKVGDIILTGTPSGVGKINENDTLVGYLETNKAFEINIL